MMKHFLFTLTVLTAFGFAGHALAADDGKTVKDVKVEHAKDIKVKDGKKFDREKFHAEMFAKTDKDGDGVLSKDEFLDSHRERAEKAFDMLDADKDGYLSKDELKEGRKHWKKRMHKRGGHMDGHPDKAVKK